jgi:class 3 adenylate cyclase
VTPVENVRAWLEGNGFGRFTDLFEENEIDGEVLVELTDDDLAKLGLPLGPRKKLLNAIANLDQATSPGAATAPLGSGPPEPAAPRSEAERRQLTVLFCDLVGSTALSGRLDPEDMREVIRAYQDTCAGVIARFEGFVAKFMGDGVLAYFGYQRPLAARVGIATGLVVVGDLIGEGAAREQAVVGDTPNLAARLQGLAVPGSVVVAEGTQRLLGGRFDYADLGTHALKGLAEPVQAWRAVGESQVEGRFEAMRGERLTPLVGRDHEIALLLDRWQLAKGGEGQVVLLSGEPGIGKSRITQALREHLEGEPHTLLRYYCSPYHTNSALRPVIDQMARAAGFRPDDSAETKLDKLEALLGRWAEKFAGSRVRDLVASTRPSCSNPRSS